MNDELLGRLERIDLRAIWTSEPAGFTPWLAQAENLEILADTLGIDLELEAQEKEVGPFRADILCKDIGTDSWVLVEKRFQGLLKDQKHEIEEDLAYSLEWEELPSKRDCRIACYLRGIDPEDESNWPRQHDWLASHLNDLHRVFCGRVRSL